VNAFDHLGKQRNVVVSTYRRDGSTVSTPVHVVVNGDHAYFRTWSTSGKAKRLRRDPHLEIAPSRFFGKKTGPDVRAVARLLDGEEARTVARLLADKYPLLQGRLVPLAHRLRKYDTVHYELTESARP
jgi:PPOX class probable F420-dependent enzyme